GTGPARDIGIVEAGNDCDHVILLDAHMNFPSTFDWAKRLTDRCVSLKNEAVVGAGSCDIDHKTYQMGVKGNHGLSFGTTIKSMTYGRETEKDEVKHRAPNHIFESKWRPRYGSLPGLTQSVLGACYCFSRDWYMDDLRRPWQGMEHWGTLEQSLTIPNWLAGGCCYVEPIPIGHLYRQGNQVPYKQDNAMRWYNKFRLLDILPMEEKLREKMRNHLMKNPEVMHRFEDIKAAVQRNKPVNDALKAYYAEVFEETVES
ncbi:unnamed protein product, partial [marine sediment metagenome]